MTSRTQVKKLGQARDPRGKKTAAAKVATSEDRITQLHSEEIAIENVKPEIAGGRFPSKRVLGDMFGVSADIFKAGNDQLRASLRYRKKGEESWIEVEMTQIENDRWSGEFLVDEVTRYEYIVQAWTDEFESVVNRIKKWEAREDVNSSLEEIITLLSDAFSRSEGDDKAELSRWSSKLKEEPTEEAVKLVEDEKLRNLVAKYALRKNLVRYRSLELVVDPPSARFSAWYEMFHRSQGTVPGRSATFTECERRLPEIKEMGFDIIYLPPIHPVGHTNRRGQNGKREATTDDPGSPWAIGSEAGGHTSINPELGTMEDFLHFVSAAREMGMDIAIDLAFQCSPDHPYTKKHPDWFYRRNDGSIKYAENPPKRYYDIFPLYFEGESWRELWLELLSITRFWVMQGIKIFRVDNPHTKPLCFWEWLISEVKRSNPEVIFLSESFTRPKIMKRLAKLGFTQSYTYFAWKNTKSELTEFLKEFVLSDVSDYFRGNFFTNTPDILTEYLQKGSKPAFKIRLVLAATLSSLYGIYNGFELCENKAVASGSEEYLDSEKYQYKVWDWNRPDNIKHFITKLNRIRKENRALWETSNLRLLPADNENIFFYGKWTKDKSNVVLVAINLDPYSTHECTVTVPILDLGIAQDQRYKVYDTIKNVEYEWYGAYNYVRLDPNDEPAHVLVLKTNASQAA